MDNANEFKNEIAPVFEYVELQEFHCGEYEPNGGGDLVHFRLVDI